MYSAILSASARNNGLGLRRAYSDEVRNISAPGGSFTPGPFNGFAGLGDMSPSNRPSIDYVKSGDVIRVYVAYDPDFYFGGSGIGAAFSQNLISAFNIVRAPAASTSGDRAWVVDVQPRSDYSRLQDAVSVVLNAAQRAGLSVNAGTSYGQFISKVEDTGGTPGATIEQPGGAPGSASDPLAAISNFASKLGQSPTTLAVILGAAVILVIAAKGR